MAFLHYLTQYELYINYGIKFSIEDVTVVHFEAVLWSECNEIQYNNTTSLKNDSGIELTLQQQFKY